MGIGENALWSYLFLGILFCLALYAMGKIHEQLYLLRTDLKCLNEDFRKEMERTTLKLETAIEAIEKELVLQGKHSGTRPWDDADYVPEYLKDG